MGISILRTHLDPGAPVVFPADGSLLDMLKAVLVTGFGDFPGLGWTLEFEQARSKIVFRTKGTEMFVRLEHNPTERTAYVKAYESMSSIDSGLFVCPDPSKETAGRLFQVRTGYTGCPTGIAVPWMVLGDDKGVWVGLNPLYIQYGAGTTVSNSWKFVYIGDYIPYDPTNVNYNFCLMQDIRADLYTWGTWTLHWFTQQGNHYHAMRLPNRTSGAVTLGMSSGTPYNTNALGAGDGISVASGMVQHTSIPEIHSGGLLLGRIPGLKNSLSKQGNNGAGITTVADLQLYKPEMCFDYGDYKEHFYLTMYMLAYPSVTPAYFVLTEGKGFRNVI
jgi:hypothetical protein